MKFKNRQKYFKVIEVRMVVLGGILTGKDTREPTEMLVTSYILIWVVNASWVFSSVQLLMSNSVTPWIGAHQASLSFIISWSLLKLMSIESVMPSNHLILCCPLLFLTSIFPSIRVFSNESALHIRWPKYWSFSFSISPSNEYSRVDFLYDGLVWSPCIPTDS